MPDQTHDHASEQAAEPVAAPAPAIATPAVTGAGPMSAGPTMGAGTVMALQRSAGNTSVSGMLAGGGATLARNPQPGAAGAQPAAAPGTTGAQPTAGAAGARSELGQALTTEEQSFLNRCSEANTRIDEAQRTFTAWLASIGSAYQAAWTAHSDVLKQADVAMQAVNATLLNFAIGFIPGGAGGVIGAAMLKAGTGDFIANGIVDMAKYGITLGMQTGAGAAPNRGAAFQALPLSPTEFRNGIEGRVNQELAVATRHVGNWQHAINEHDTNFQMNFNPVAATDTCLHSQGQKLREMAPVDHDAVKRGFQKGWMADWIQNYWWYGSNFSQVEGGKVHDILNAYCAQIGLDPQPYINEDLRRYQERRANNPNKGII